MLLIPCELARPPQRLLRQAVLLMISPILFEQFMDWITDASGLSISIHHAKFVYWHIVSAFLCIGVSFVGLINGVSYQSDMIPQD